MLALKVTALEKLSHVRNCVKSLGSNDYDKEASAQPSCRLYLQCVGTGRLIAGKFRNQPTKIRSPKSLQKGKCIEETIYISVTDFSCLDRNNI